MEAPRHGTHGSSTRDEGVQPIHSTDIESESSLRKAGKRPQQGHGPAGPENAAAYKDTASNECKKQRKEEGGPWYHHDQEQAYEAGGCCAGSASGQAQCWTTHGQRRGEWFAEDPTRRGALPCEDSASYLQPNLH